MTRLTARTGILCDHEHHQDRRRAQPLAVDLADPDDAKVLTNDPQGEVLVHLGSSNYLDRYKVYVSHVQQWRQQFDKLESVDLRYDRQIVVNPDSNNTVKRAPLALSAAKAAMAAGVKPAALITHQRLGGRPPATVKPVTVSLKTPGPAPAKKPVKVAKRKPSIGPVKAKAAAPRPVTKAAAPRPVTKAAVQSRATLQHHPKSAAPSPPVNTAVKKKPSPAIAKGPDQP